MRRFRSSAVFISTSRREADTKLSNRRLLENCETVAIAGRNVNENETRGRFGPSSDRLPPSASQISCLPNLQRVGGVLLAIANRNNPPAIQKRASHRRGCSGGLRTGKARKPDERSFVQL